MYSCATTSSTSSDGALQLTSKEFGQDFLGLLREAPVEDGYTHPAEVLLEQSLKTQREVALWIQTIFIDHQKNPAIASGILKCIGRLRNDLVEPWGKLMVKTGLQQASLDIRDAAVTALELWGDQEAVGLLKSHTEATPWLARYIKQVIEDVSH